jgi:hypothetical protein
MRKDKIKMPAEPISPNEVVDAKLDAIPEIVIFAFNELVAKNWNGYKSVVKQEDAIQLVIQKWQENGDERDAREQRGAIFRNHMLDIEDIYRAKGWNVEYDKPGYNESYDAFYTFTKA